MVRGGDGVDRRDPRPGRGSERMGSNSAAPAPAAPPHCISWRRARRHPFESLRSGEAVSAIALVCAGPYHLEQLGFAAEQIVAEGESSARSTPSAATPRPGGPDRPPGRAGRGAPERRRLNRQGGLTDPALAAGHCCDHRSRWYARFGRLHTNLSNPPDRAASRRRFRRRRCRSRRWRCQRGGDSSGWHRSGRRSP